MSRRSRLLRLALAFFAFVVLGVMVMPGRLWFGQRDAIAQAEAQLTELKADNGELARRVKLLGSDELIEREAHDGFGWVYPGDELYTITPPPPLSVELPDVWPFDLVEQSLVDAAADT